jgi:TatD DNase family protein
VPVIIHVRDAHDDAISVLKKFAGIRGVIHCFTGGVSEAKKYLDMGLFIFV